MDDLTDIAEHADGEDSGSTSFEDEKLPSDCVTYPSDIPTLCSGVRQSENYECSDEFWNELPLDYPHSTPTASTQARLKCQQLRSLHRKSAKIDPTYCSDLLEGNPPSVRLLCRLTRLCHTRSRSDTDPFIQAYVNNMKATTLIDTGATSSFVSATFWHKLGSPTLSHPRSSFVSADNSQLEMLGRIKLTINLAGRKVLFPFWVMSTALTDCIVGIDLLRQMGAIINLNDNTLSIDGCDELISLSPLSPAQQETHPTGPVTVATATQIPPRSFQWIACSAGSDLPTLTTILVEPNKSALLHVAAALYRTNPSRTVLLEVANPSDSPIHLPAHAILGTWMALPKDHLESTLDSHDSRARTDNGQSSQTTDEPRRVFTQIGGPGVVCPVQSETTPTKELPIDWTESSLSIDQRELLCKTLMNIDTGNNPPIRSVPYRTSKAEGDIMEAELNQYLDLGLIRPSKSPWSSPVLMIRKPDGSIRFCIDYRKLNSVTVKDSYPMPRIDDLLDVLGRAKLFSTMDIASGYWNVPMAKDSIEKTAFTCKYGLYEWLVMPFGLCNAVLCFERLMEHILIDYKWRTCLVYLDDCIVYSEDFGSHLIRLSQVLTKFREAGFKLKMSKCKWGRSSVPFLGHIVTPAGILPNPEKIKSVLRVKALKDASEVRAFLGLAGYVRRFVRDFSKIAAPLTNLLTAEQFIWSTACDEALESLKRSLVDASHIAVGAVLMQKQQNKNRVIAYASQSLTKAQQKWISKEMGISEIECWGIVWATRKFRPYIDRRHFDIYTDHEALTWLLNTGSRSGNHKLARWAMKIQGLDYTVIHRPGELNGAADGLSRLAVCPIQTRRMSRLNSAPVNLQPSLTHEGSSPDPTESNTPAPGSSQSKNPLQPLIPRVSTTPMELFDRRGRPSPRLYNEQANDPWIVALRAYLEDGAIPLDPYLQNLVVRNSQQYLMQQGIVCRYITIKTSLRNPELIIVPVIPHSLVEEVLYASHSSSVAGHLGLMKTRERIRRTAYWLNWQLDCKDYVSKCPDCSRAKGGRPWRQGPMQRMPIYSLRGPFGLLVVDALGPLPTTNRGNKYILVFADYFTRWVEAFPVADLKTSTFSRVLIDEVLCRFGIPDKLLSDRGSNFVSELATTMYTTLGIHKLASAPYHPQGQGLVERFNHTIVQMMKIYVNDHHTDWDTYLPRLLFAYRTAHHETLGDSP
ncbi:hypothetical protein AeMF1_019899, partial [Aphanomyces euteiches]